MMWVWITSAHAWFLLLWASRMVTILVVVTICIVRRVPRVPGCAKTDLGDSCVASGGAAVCWIVLLVLSPVLFSPVQQPSLYSNQLGWNSLRTYIHFLLSRQTPHRTWLTTKFDFWVASRSTLMHSSSFWVCALCRELGNVVANGFSTEFRAVPVNPEPMPTEKLSASQSYKCNRK